MAVEIIFQCGDKEFWDAHEEDKQLMEAVCQKILKWLQIYLPDFKVANAVVHLDETSPHMHVVGVPVGRGFKNGPETKVSKRSVFTKETLSVVLQDKLRKVANAILRERFGVDEKNKAIISRIIKDTMESGYIKLSDENASPKMRRYIPYRA